MRRVTTMQGLFGAGSVLLVVAVMAMGSPSSSVGDALPRSDSRIDESPSSAAAGPTEVEDTSASDSSAPLGSVPPSLGAPRPPSGGSDAAPSSAPQPQVVDQTWTAGVPRGQYRLVLTLSAAAPARADVIVSGEMVASYALTTAARTVEALVHIDGPSSVVGVRAPVSVTVGSSNFAPIPASYTTRGTRILAPDGSDWTFEGVNRLGYELAPDGTPAFNQYGHEGAAMWSWGMNAVRLPLNQEYWLSNCEVPRSWAHSTPQRADGSSWRYQDVIDAEIASFTQLGMLVLLDLHTASRNQSTGCVHQRDAAIHEMPDARSVVFWRSVATRYGEAANVAFDLYNEAHLQDTADPPEYAEAQRIWRDGGTVTYADSSSVVPRRSSYDGIGMQRLYNEVRATRATNLVFVSGLYYAHRPEVMMDMPLDATGLVASVHMYCLGCDEIPPPEQVQYVDGERPGEADRPGVGDRYPTVITEFGSDEWWDAADDRKYIEYFRSRGYGWGVWVWAGGGSGAGRSPFGILAHRTDTTPDRTPGGQGMAVWDALAGRRAARGY